MIGAISGANASYGVYLNRNMLYRAAQANGAQAPQNTQNLQNVSRPQRTGGTWTAQRAASPEIPVQPVRPVTPVDVNKADPVSLGLPIREGADPAEMAVRMRIRPYEDPAAQAPQDQPAEDAAGAKGVQEAFEEGQCQTCEKRKYQDGSDDMGVSFQTPTRIAPEQVASAVRGHEQEHVVREQAKAQREDRRVVSQSVTLHTDICPECGKTYISGGTTRTVTAAEQGQQAEQQSQEETQRKGFSIYG